jgi:GT2 family glycosyltransferase
MNYYSIVVPVYNRPDEVDELLESLTRQTAGNFEVIIVEDGSQRKCKDVCERYADILALSYYDKPNSGPGQSRNYGAERAKGNWIVILDSDVVLPETYMEAVDRGIGDAEAYGGPDAAHPSFTPTQKAISYSMTSFFTTGGIRGGKKKLDKFYPRSYNMIIRADAYKSLGGFRKMRFGEDIDFSYRMVEAGYKTCLLPEAWVWHKRRTDLRKFWRQVYNSGIARINLEMLHPGTMKLVHMLPAVFTVGVAALVLCAVAALACRCPLLAMAALSPIILYSVLILVDSARGSKSLKVGMLSVPAAFTQLMGYGTGFVEAWWKRCVRKEKEFTAYDKNFYK